MQKYQFFLNQRSLVFVKSASEILLSQKPPSEVVHLKTPSNFNSILKLSKNNDVDILLVCGDALEDFVHLFQQSFPKIEAGGGLVEALDGSLLCIYRNGKWDLPKGKNEKGEALIETAIREVEEECGISGLTVVDVLPETFHLYIDNEAYILKKTYWYRMNISSKQILIPQTEEGITQAEWISREQIQIVLDNTYPSIRLLIEEYYIS